jgi:hypothetical protein
VDYFDQLFALPKDRKSGVYTVDCGAGSILTIDDEGSVWEVHADGSTQEHIVTPLIPTPTHERSMQEPADPEASGPHDQAADSLQEQEAAENADNPEGEPNDVPVAKPKPLREAKYTTLRDV